MLLRVLCSIALFVVCASAQRARTVPAGFENVRGNQAFFHWASPGRVLQVIDVSNTTPAAGIQQIAFRRHASALSLAVRGTAEVELTMSHSEWSTISTEFARNQRAGTQVVHKKKTIVVPDWTARPTNTAFDFVLKFDAPWSYRGNAAPATPALVWTLRYSNSTAGLHHMDRQGGITLYDAGRAIGSGCSGFTHSMRVANTGGYHTASGFHLDIAATQAPRSSPVFLFLDGRDSDLQVAGLCSRLHVIPTILMLLGASDPNGVLAHRYLTIGHVPSVEGATIYSQLVAVDMGRTPWPFSVSEARVFTVPRNISRVGSPTCTLWADGAAATHAIGNAVTFAGAPIAELRK